MILEYPSQTWDLVEVQSSCGFSNEVPSEVLGAFRPIERFSCRSPFKISAMKLLATGIPLNRRWIGGSKMGNIMGVNKQLGCIPWCHAWTAANGTACFALLTHVRMDFHVDPLKEDGQWEQGWWRDRRWVWPQGPFTAAKWSAWVAFTILHSVDYCISFDVGSTE